MAESSAPSVEQDFYWQEFTQLKLDACYVRDYRDAIAGWERGVATLRAITSSASIGAWVIWQSYAFVWATLIAASQVADALRDVFPFRKRRQALSGWSNALNRLFVDAQRDWDGISAGSLSNARISSLTHQLRKSMQSYEQTYMPDGLPRKQKLFDAAQEEMETSSERDTLSERGLDRWIKRLVPWLTIVQFRALPSRFPCRKMFGLQRPRRLRKQQ